MANKMRAMKKANTVNNEVELEQKKKALKPISEEKLKQCNTIDLIEMLTERLKDCRFDKHILELCQPMLDKLAARFRISDTQAMMLAVGVEHPSGLDVNDVATFFSCSNVRASSYFRQCRTLEKAGIMCKRNSFGDDNYYITKEADEALQADRDFVAIWDKKYTADEFVDRVQDVFSIMEDLELDYVDGVEMLKRYFRTNTHLTYVSEINELHLPPLEFIVLVLMCHSVVWCTIEKAGDTCAHTGILHAVAHLFVFLFGDQFMQARHLLRLPVVVEQRFFRQVLIVQKPISRAGVKHVFDVVLGKHFVFHLVGDLQLVGNSHAVVGLKFH